MSNNERQIGELESRLLKQSTNEAKALANAVLKPLVELLGNHPSFECPAYVKDTYTDKGIYIHPPHLTTRLFKLIVEQQTPIIHEAKVNAFLKDITELRHKVAELEANIR